MAVRWLRGHQKWTITGQKAVMKSPPKNQKNQTPTKSKHTNTKQTKNNNTKQKRRTKVWQVPVHGLIHARDDSIVSSRHGMAAKKIMACSMWSRGSWIPGFRIVLCCFTHSTVWLCVVCVWVFSFVLFRVPIRRATQKSDSSRFRVSGFGVRRLKPTFAVGFGFRVSSLETNFHCRFRVSGFDRSWGG